MERPSEEKLSRERLESYRFVLQAERRIGLACNLAGVRDEGHLFNGPMAGHLFENFCVQETVKFLLGRGVQPPLYYIRTGNGLEVDLLIEPSAGICKDWRDFWEIIMKVKNDEVTAEGCVPPRWGQAADTRHLTCLDKAAWPAPTGCAEHNREIWYRFLDGY